MTGSNRRPSACKADALPAELILRGIVQYDPYGIRTRVTAVKGRCLNHLTNGPLKKCFYKEVLIVNCTKCCAKLVMLFS